MKNVSCSNSIEVFRDEVREKEKTINQAMLDAFRNCRREKAKEYFELALKYNELYEISKHAEELTTLKLNVTFLLDYWFLQDLIKHLTPRYDEEVVYVTGNDFDKFRMPYRICPIALEKQSVVYARGTARSCADVLIELHEKNYRIQLVAHSHPGSGPDATAPSGIDINYLAKIQSTGSDAVGVIVTRDGHVRFFTVYAEFTVSIKGREVKNVGENIFKVPLT